MDLTQTKTDFSKHYLVFGHGLRIVNKTNPEKIDTNFPLGPSYRVITLHKPGETIYSKLVKIITNQIEKKSNALNDLFLIKCPIARSHAKVALENAFIRDYFIDTLKSHPDQLPIALADILYEDHEDPEILKITTIPELNKYLDTVNYPEIKSQLNFEIRTYRPGDLCPKLLIDFKISPSLSSLKGGVYNTKDFSNFNYDKFHEAYALSQISRDTEDMEIPLVRDFNIEKQYVFDESDTLSGQYDSFFERIKYTVPTGLIIVLSCGTYSAKPNGMVRRASIERQNAPYRKYLIKYD